MMKLLLLIGAAIVVVLWWRRRSSRPAPPPVDEAYICPACDETDCICEKKTDQETRSQP
jgi:hypothetical protein